MKWWLAIGILAVGCQAKDEVAEPVGPIHNSNDDIHISPSPPTLGVGPQSNPNKNGITIQAKRDFVNYSKIVITFVNRSNHAATVYSGGDFGFQCTITSLPHDRWRDKGGATKSSPNLDPAKMVVTPPSGSTSVTVYPFPIFEPVKTGEFLARIRYDDEELNRQGKALGWKKLSTVGRTEDVPIYLRSDSSDFLWPSPTN